MSYWDAGKRFVPKREGRGTGNYEFFELSLAQGPTAIGVTGQNRLIDFIGTAWLLLLDLDMQLHLFRQGSVGEWEEVTTNLPSVVFGAPLPVGARRVSFAFDQSARIIVAYELDGMMRVTQWSPNDNAYVQRGPFAGVDPFVVFDAVWAYDIDSSDVLLFYLSPDRERVRCRVQRDNFGVSLPVHDYAQPSVLDRVVRLPWKYQVLASDAAGDPREVGGARTGLRSLLYPVNVRDRVAFTASGPSADYVLSMFTLPAAESPLGFSVSAPSATYVPSVIDGSGEELPLTLAVSAPEVAYVLSLFTEDGEAGGLSLATVAPSCEYVFSLLTTQGSESPLSFGAVMNEGSYELG